jgi:Fe-S-cluster-containing dehydrogenase component
MVLNPDVVVRDRGVMEKCSFCVQGIQAAKLKAKKAGRKVQDDDVQSACAEACPTNAILFGDLNDTESLVAEKAADERSYNLLEEVANTAERVLHHQG